MTERLALLLLGLALSGCASASGQDWLSSPLDAQAELAPGSVETTAAVADSRPRLAHTVTLGESYESVAVSPGAAGPASVQVNVNTQVPVIINNWGGYGGYGYGAYGYGSYGARSVSTPVRTTTSSTATKVGSDFPAPPDYGPRALK
jgi:hypothetical protein